MKRYLLFDSGCSVCDHIAQAIEEAAAGKLEAVSIHDARAREWLDQAYPGGWEHRPYLVTVGGDRVKASAGTGMALRLGLLLGPPKAWRIALLARRSGVPLSGVGLERRRLLQQGGALLAGLTLFGLPKPGQWSGQPENRSPSLGLPPGEWPLYGDRPVPPASIDPSDLVIITQSDGGGGGTIEAQCDSSCCACPTDGANPCGCCCGYRLYPVGNPYWAECWDGCCTPCCYCCGWCRKQYWEVQPWYYQCNDGSIRLGAVPTGRYSCSLSLSCC